MKIYISLLLTLFVLSGCNSRDLDTEKKNAGQKVIILSDMVNSYDDGVAYLMLAASEDIDLLAVITTTGNTWAAEGLAYAIRQGEIAGASHTKFILGSSLPLRDGRLSTLESEVASAPGPDSYWLGAKSYPQINDWQTHYITTYGEKPTFSPTDVPAVDYIIDTVKKNPGEVTILCIGPCTDLAKALQKEPETASLAKQVVYMGGAVYCGGNTTTYAELNFLYDPEAAAICLRSPFRKQVLVSLDVCNKVLMDSSQYYGIYNSINSEKLKDVFRKNYYWDEFSSNPSATAGIWDVISAAYILDSTLVSESQTIRVDVDDNPQSPEYGRSFPASANRCQQIFIPTEINTPKFFNMIKQAMMKY